MMENQTNENKEIVEIERVIFKEVNDDELAVIEQIKSQNVKKKYFKKMLISAVVIIVIAIVQSMAGVTRHNSFSYMFKNMNLFFDEFKKYIVWIIVAFIIFNVISLFYMVVKRQLVMLTENYYILYDACVNDMYMGKDLNVEGKERRNYYVVFECDQGVCSNALATKKGQYKNTKIGDKIVVLKAVSAEGDTLKYLKDDEFRSFYNSRIKKA